MVTNKENKVKHNLKDPNMVTMVKTKPLKQYVWLNVIHVTLFGTNACAEWVSVLFFSALIFSFDLLKVIYGLSEEIPIKIR